MKYIIGCTTDLNVRAIYFARYKYMDNSGKRFYECAGLPIMFLRDKGMEEMAEQLVNDANKGCLE